METLTGTWKIMQEGAEAGTLRVYTEGLMTVVEAQCTSAWREPFRLWVQCGGRQISLGTMLPEGEHFVLRRRLSRQALRELGLTGIEACRIGTALPEAEAREVAEETPAPQSEPPPAEEEPWRPEPHPERLFREPELARALAQTGGVLVRRPAGQVQFAVPLELGRPFPLMQLFRLGRWEKIDGRNYMTFTLPVDKGF